jgi:hypothetical protein
LGSAIDTVESRVDKLSSSGDAFTGATRPRIILSDSPLFLPLTYREGSSYKIEIPIGFFIRIHLLLHLALRHLADHANCVLEATHYHARTNAEFYLPCRFEPIFGPFESVAALQAAASSIMGRFPVFGIPALEIGLAFQYACLATMFHELAHISRDHLSRIAEGRSQGQVSFGETTFTMTEALKVFELEADTWSAKWTLQEAVASSLGFSPTAQLRALVRGWMAVFSLFDTPARYLNSIEGTCYCHPVVRYEFVRGTWDFAVARERKDYFAETETDSWRVMIYCMDRAVIDSVSDADVAQKSDAGLAILPLHSFNLGISATDMRMVDEAYNSHFELYRRYYAAGEQR